MEEESQNPDIIGVDENGIPIYKEISIPDLATLDCDETGPRLIISKLVIENFKSYAGIKTLGPFHKNFTAIIGPNGSGKSNVIDSILFVFGFRATKIRSKKLSVLIHESDAHRNVTSCCVTVHFQKILDDGIREKNVFNVVEGSEFEVSRTAFKDGSSYYKINDRKVHFKEIEKVLMAAGVDLVHNRFLILQGEVEQLSLMKPKAANKNEEGLLEFLEDIIGSNRFKDPIEVLANRLTDLTELKTEKYQRLKMIEGEKDELAEERNEALMFLQLENDVTKANNQMLQKQLLEVKREEEEAREASDKMKEEAKEVEEKCQEVTSLIKEKTKEHQEFIKHFKKLLKEKEKNKEKFQWFEEQDVKGQVEVKQVLVTIKKLEEKIKSEEAKLEEYKMIPEKQENDIAVMEKKMKKMQAQKEQQEERFNQVMATFQDETKDLQAQKFSKESELLQLQKAVNEDKKKYLLAKGELDLLRSTQNKDANKATEVEQSISRLEATIEEKEKLLHESQESLPGIQESLQAVKKEFEALVSAEKNKMDVIKELSTRVEIARSNLHSAQNNNKVLDFLMDLKRSGKIPAIMGRLGDLGAIDKRYDVAISTACSLLDYIVVEDMNSVQRCIEELQRAEVGRASFIGLDKMAVWKEHCSKQKTFPENAPRLFDLVKASSPALSPAFYFALRDTLVANDIHQATRIAYGGTRYRVVTLGGQLIDLSGTMSGGGKKVISGKMGSRIKEDVNPAELRKMEMKLENAQREVQTSHEEKYRLQQQMEALQKNQREVSMSIQKGSNEIMRLQQQMEGFGQQLKELQARIKTSKKDDKEASQMQKKVDALKDEYDKVQSVATEMEEQIHKLHKEIMDIGGSQFEAIEAEKCMLESQVEQLRTASNKLTVSITSAKRKAAKSEASITTMKQEFQEAADKLVSLKEEKKNIEVEAHQLLTCLNKVEAEVKESEVELNRILQTLTQYSEKEKESKRLLLEMGRRREKVEEDLQHASRKAEAITAKLSSLVLHEIDEKPKEYLEKLTPEEARKVDTAALMQSVALVQERLSRLKPNMASIQEYKKKNEMYLKRAEVFMKVSTLKETQKSLHGEFKRRRLDEFMTGFSMIKSKLKEVYQTITLGGNAELELVDTLDAFAEGVVFSVRPPKKSWKNISNLSGGEKTLSSLALIFALHQYKATPFYVMDEIDAALDFKNASIVANYIKNRTENAQFIVISLRDNTYELSDRLVGIYKVFNCTNSITVNLHSSRYAVVSAAAAAAGDNVLVNGTANVNAAAAVGTGSRDGAVVNGYIGSSGEAGSDDNHIAGGDDNDGRKIDDDEEGSENGDADNTSICMFDAGQAE